MNPANEGFAEALEEIKGRMIKDGGQKIVPGVIENILEVDDYPRGDEAGYYIQETMLEKLIWTTHAIACTKIFDTFIKMVKDGAVKVDEKKVSKMASHAAKDMIKDLKQALKKDEPLDRETIRAFRAALEGMEVSPEKQGILDELKSLLKEADEHGE